MKNIIVLVIDGLSKWYIDRIKKDTFFEFLDDNTYCYDNLFSVGPFTEAAVRGFWSACNPLEGVSYLSETCYKKERFQEWFSESHYMYYGELTPYFTDGIKYDNKNLKREKSWKRGFEHIWKNRIKYYINSAENNKSNIWKVEFILENYFKSYNRSPEVISESKKYFNDKLAYIKDIIINKTESSFFSALSNELYYDCENANMAKYKKQFNHVLSVDEAFFIKEAKDKNISYILEAKDEESIKEKELSGTSNRCIHSNNDLLSQMRDENEYLPKLKEELDDFFNWYDSEGNTLEKPFFAYIHNYDFHYPENFINSRYNNREEYDKEVCALRKKLHSLNNRNMSVSKQLSLLLIADNLKYLWEEVQKRGLIDDTCIVITADHGISNFMYPLNKSENRWNYTRTNFNVPMYIYDKSIPCQHNKFLYSSINFFDIIKKININEFNNDNSSDNKYIFTSWINGVPDFEREKIKIGIRSKKYSITCEGYFTQLFPSLKIKGIYDLINDPDEVKEIPFEKANDDKFFKCLYDNMNKEWVKLVNNIILYADKRYGFKDKYQYYIDNQEVFCSESNYDEKKYHSLLDLAKKIIIFGLNNNAVKILEGISDKLELKAIWDIGNVSPKSKFFGHNIKKPDTKDVTPESIIVICTDNEIEYISYLEEKKIHKYITYFDYIKIG